MWVSKQATTAALIFGTMLVLPVQAEAQTWPGRPITIVAPFAAGSGTDALARIIAPALAGILGVQVIVENVGGAGGMNGSARVARAEPDGYQLVLGNVGTHAHNQTLYKSPSYNAETDFEPVGMVADLAPVLIARANFAGGSLKDFIAEVKKNETNLQYGSSGTGSASQLACALLNATAGLKVTHVPYRGAPMALQDLVAGRIDYQCALLPAPLGQIQSNQVKAIAVLTSSRIPALPNLPTAEEQGVSGVEASAWHALFAPRGTPPAVVARLNAAINGALNTTSVQAQLAEQGATVAAPDRRSADSLRSFVKGEIARWADTIRALNLQME